MTYEFYIFIDNFVSKPHNPFFHNSIQIALKLKQESSLIIKLKKMLSSS